MNAPGPMRYHFDLDEMTPEEEAERFRYFTRAQFEAAFKASGLPDRCTDPDTLRRAAEHQVAAEERTRERGRSAL